MSNCNQQPIIDSEPTSSPNIKAAQNSSLGLEIPITYETGRSSPATSDIHYRVHSDSLESSINIDERDDCEAFKDANANFDELGVHDNSQIEEKREQPRSHFFGVHNNRLPLPPKATDSPSTSLQNSPKLPEGFDIPRRSGRVKFPVKRFGFDGSSHKATKYRKY